MQKKTKKHLARLLAAAIVLSGVPVQQTQAAGTVRLSSRKITIIVGESKTITLKNNKKKTVWKLLSGKKSIRIRNVNKNSVKIAAVKAGRAKVQVKAGKKKYTCTVMVKAAIEQNSQTTVTQAPDVASTAKPTQTPYTTSTLNITTQPNPTEIPGMTGQPISTNSPNNTNEPVTTEQSASTGIPGTAGPSIPTETPGTTKIPNPTATPIVPNYSIGDSVEIPFDDEESTDTTQKVSYAFIPEETGIYDLGWMCQKGSYSVSWVIVEPGSTTSSSDSCYSYEDSDGRWTYREGVVFMKDVVYQVKLEFSDIASAEKSVFKIQKSNRACEDIQTEQAARCDSDSVNTNTHFYKLTADRAGYYTLNCDFDVTKGCGADFLRITCYSSDGHSKFFSSSAQEDGMGSISEDNQVYLKSGEEVILMIYCNYYAGSDILTVISPITAEQRNAQDVAALQKIINQQKSMEAAISSEWDAEEYVWNESGRLVSIQWSNKRLQGNLDVSGLTALEKLFCGNNRLSGLDVSRNVSMISLQCYNNQLSSLDVSQNTALITLSCEGNQLNNLNVSQNTALEKLFCERNQLKSLDVSRNAALISLSCNNNQLSSLEVGQNVVLTELFCSGNQLSNLDVSSNVALTTLYCERNQLKSLDVSENIELTTLSCDPDVKIIDRENTKLQ